MAGEYTSGPLGEAGAQLWDSITSAYELDPAELALLDQACQTVDYLWVMDGVLMRDKFTAQGRYSQTVAHPLLASVAEHRRLLAALLGQLKLPAVADADIPLPADVPRLPATRKTSSG